MSILTQSELRDAIVPAASRLLASGRLEVVRVIKSIRSNQHELEFAVVPARAGSIARRIVVHLEDSGLVRQPRFDASKGVIDLFYPERDHPEVQALLNSKRNRLCYYWESAKGEQAHAWLLSSG
jgi:hypothetical protein